MNLPEKENKKNFENKLALTDQSNQKSSSKKRVPASTFKKELIKQPIGNYMPLAVGNSWTYLWTNHILDEENTGDDHYLKTVLSLSLGKDYHGYKKFLVPQASFDKNSFHLETYTIIKSEYDKFYFKIELDSDRSKIQEVHSIRDGRYEANNEFYWIWTDSKFHRDQRKVLTEYMLRRYSNEFIFDKRNQLILTDWSLVENKYKVNKFDLELIKDEQIENDVFTSYYDYQANSVSVIAGNFEKCLHTIESYSTTYGKADNGQIRTVKWTVHMFWAVNVGKVLEYQELENGQRTYTLELLSYQF